MRQLEKTGKTVDEAVELALREMQTSIDNVIVEVVEEPSKGLLGIIGSKQARVRVTVKEDEVLVSPEETLDEVSVEEMQKIIKEFLASVLTEMGINPDIEIVVEEDTFFTNVEGEGLGLLIGKRGQTLEAVQYITNIVANRHSGKRIRVIIDAEGYRKRREEVLQQLANRLANRVERGGESIMLEPMTAHERKIIHTTLQNNPKVLTRSEGEEPNRKVIIQAKE
jgi:spoIIIJ-associated protein